MLIQFFNVFVNFTAVNSHFLSDWRKRKPDPEVQNSRFTTPPCRLKTQTKDRSQSRTGRWQNTIFGFLEAQLDFLAIFFTPP